MESKSILLSKTFWLNLFAFAVALATYVDPELLTIIGLLPEQQMEVMKLVGTFIAIGNLILRAGVSKTVRLPKVNKDAGAFLLICGIVFTSSGCQFIKDVQARSSIVVEQAPSSPNDTLSVVASFWDAGNLIHQYAPGNNKFGRFVKQSTKHCDVQLVRLPKDINDTLSVRLRCDSMYHTLQSLKPKK